MIGMCKLSPSLVNGGFCCYVLLRVVSCCWCEVPGNLSLELALTRFVNDKEFKLRSLSWLCCKCVGLSEGKLVEPRSSRVWCLIARFISTYEDLHTLIWYASNASRGFVMLVHGESHEVRWKAGWMASACFYWCGCEFDENAVWQELTCGNKRTCWCQWQRVKTYVTCQNTFTQIKAWCDTQTHFLGGCGRIKHQLFVDLLAHFFFFFWVPSLATVF